MTLLWSQKTTTLEKLKKLYKNTMNTSCWVPEGCGRFSSSTSGATGAGGGTACTTTVRSDNSRDNSTR